MGAFLKFLAGILGKEAVSQVRERAGKIWRRHIAKDVLIGHRAAPKVNFQDRVPEELGRLAKGSLSEDFNKLGLRDWLADPTAQMAFAELLEVSLTGSPVNTDAWKTIETFYEQHTGETKKLAPGRIDAILGYLRSRFFGSATESESAQTALLTAILRNLSNRDTDDIPSLRDRATAPARALLDRGKTRWHYPDVVVPLRLDLSETFRLSHDTLRQIGQQELLTLIQRGTNVFLVGEAGAGKTTTLIDLCAQLVNEKVSPLPVFLDAATWAASGKPLLDHIASLPVFSSAGLSITALARLNEAGQLLVVLNGWNEISTSDQAGSRDRLQQFLTGATKVRMLVASRSANDSLGIPNPKRVTVQGFDWEQQKSLIRQNIDRAQAEVLIARLRSDRKLRAVTQNPLVLTSVLLIQKTGHAIPDSPYDLLEAVVDAYEKEEGRAAALARPPVRSFHRLYLEAIAQAMNMSAATILSTAEAQRVVHSVSQRVMAEGRLAQPPEPTDLVKELCDQHLLHRTDDAALRFAHQRFQEFFGACHLFGRLKTATSNESEGTDIQRDILNLPFWEDAVLLAATKLADNPALSAEKVLLVKLSIPVDLGFAARLAGDMHLGNTDGDVWNELCNVLNVLHANPAPEARQYALEAIAATRSCDFAHLFWPLLESEEQQVRLGAYRLGGGLTLDQLGPDAAKRMNSWPEERRTESVRELADRWENLSFVENLAQNDSVIGVRAVAIQALYEFYLASDAALNAWRSAPDDTKESNAALDTALMLWQADAKDITSELVALARKSGNDAVKHQIGLRLLGQAEDIGIEAARQALRTEPERRDIDDLVAFLKSADPVYLRNLAVELVWSKRRVAGWAREQIAALPELELRAFFDKALEQMSTTEHESFDASVIGSLATQAQIKSLLDEGLLLVATLWSRKPLKESTRLRYHAIEHLLGYAPSGPLMQAILDRAPSCAYDGGAWLTEILDRRALDAEGGNTEKTLWRPNTQDLDMLLAILRDKRDPRDVPHCKLDADLASLCSKTDPRRYLPYLLEVAGRHADAWRIYEAALGRWIASPHRERPSNPPYCRQVAQAFQRCGFSAIDALISIANEPGAEHIVPDALVLIVVQPWIEHGGKRSVFPADHFSEHRKRRSARRVFQQPNDVLQTPTDEVARYLVREIDAIMAPDGMMDGIDPSKPSKKANHFWEMAKRLARVPSPVGIPTLIEILRRGDGRMYPFLDIAHGIIRQGGTLPAEVLPGVKQVWQRELAEPFHNNDAEYYLIKLAILHFFFEPGDAGVQQFLEILPELRKKVHLREITRAIARVRTDEAAKVLLKLLPDCKANEDYVEEILYELAKCESLDVARELIRFLDDGTLFAKTARSYRLERIIAPRFARFAEGNADDLQRLLEVLDAKSSADEEMLVCAILAEIQDPRATAILFRYLDETKYPRGNAYTFRMLEEKFARREDAKDGGGWIMIYPKACNAARRDLLSLASRPGPSQRMSRALLLNLENRRREYGRPADEPRHPDIENGTGWPHSLYGVIT